MFNQGESNDQGAVFWDNRGSVAATMCGMNMGDVPSRHWFHEVEDD